MTTPCLKPTLVTSSGKSYPISDYISYNNFCHPHLTYLEALDFEVEPKTNKEAIIDLRWKDAVDAEIKALQHTGTWTIEFLPPSTKPIGCKWVLKSNGTQMVPLRDSRLA